MTSLVSVLIAGTRSILLRHPEAVRSNRVDKVPLRDVATWRSYVNIASTVGRSAGGPIGGFLADTIGWRWCGLIPFYDTCLRRNLTDTRSRSFYIQCPLTVTAIVLVVWKLGSPPEQHNITTADEGTTTTKGKLRRVDFLGSISLALTIVGFLLVLDLGGQKLPWGHPLIWIIFAAASLSSIAFALIEAFVAREPIYPLRLLVHRDVISAYIVTVLLGSAQFGVIEDNQCVAHAGISLLTTTARSCTPSPFTSKSPPVHPLPTPAFTSFLPSAATLSRASSPASLSKSMFPSQQSPHP